MFAMQFSTREAGHYGDAMHFLCFFFTKYMNIIQLLSTVSNKVTVAKSPVPQAFFFV